MPFYVFAWIGSFFFGIESIIGKITSKHSVSNPWLFNFFWSLFILLLTLPVGLYNRVELPQHWENIFIVSVLYALANITFAMMFYFFDVSTIGPLYNLRIAFTVLLAIPILGEILTTQQYVFIAVMFVLAIVVNLDESFRLKSIIRPRLGLVIAAVLANALWGISIKRAVMVDGYWEVTLWMMIIAQIILLGTIGLFKKEIVKINKKQLGSLLGMAVAGTVGTLMANKAYAVNASITAVIFSIPFSMILAFLFSLFAPKLLEKHTHKVYAIRFAAAAVMILVGLKLSS